MQANTKTFQSQLERLNQPEWLSGSEILLRSLLLEGVDCVFGYPGGAVLYIYDAMHGNSDFRHLLTRHEQGAIHAADGYARSTGKTGVCIATSGPGATNLVTGIATAQMDSVPLVIITGNVPQNQMGTDAFQESDIVGITMPITKHSFLVRDIRDLSRTVREAFFIAQTGRKGPVLIDIPKDISAQYATFHFPEHVEVSGYQPARPLPATAQLEGLIQMIEKAEQPVILAGGGVIHAEASQGLVRFAELTSIPVVTTLMGLGGFPASHDSWIGMPGMHGCYAANMALQEADLIVGMGVRFDDRVTMKLDGFAPKAQIAHIDIDAAEINKNVSVDFALQADIQDVLEALNQHEWIRESHAAWLRSVKLANRTHPLAYDTQSDSLKPQFVIQMLSESTGGNAIVTTDVGQHQMWAAQFFRCSQPRSFLTSGGLGTMGFGFPSAIGAQIGNPDKLVISINGDGGMQMCAQELAICAIHNIPVKIVVINNRTLGMIRQWQEVIYDGRYSQIDLSGSPDFVKLAEAYGVKGLRAYTKEQAQAIWAEALEHQGPVLLDFWVDQNELVLPMIPAGKTLWDMILEV